MPQLNDEEKSELIESVKQIRLTVDKIERGVYGDEDNGVKGLLERMTDIEKWVLASRFKIAYISGAVALFTIGARMFWEWITGTHTK